MSTATIILAHGRNGVIGNHGALPWPGHREDMRRFREATLGKAVIMGRKTYDSIGKPLPWRRNIVLTNRPADLAGKVETARNMGEALRMAEAEDPHVIGGAMIYAMAMPYANRALVTEMHGEWEGDVYFKIPFLHQWREVSREAWRDGAGDCDFVEYHLPA